MSADPQQKPKRFLRNPLLYTSILLGIAVLWVGLVMLSRRQKDRAIEQRIAQQAAEKRKAEDQRVVETLGGNRFEIISFYALPGVVRRGESAQLCYGVSNAKSVRLEPPIEPVWPSASRCFEVAPKKDTTYTLTAEDAEGHAKSATLEIRVR